MLFMGHCVWDRGQLQAELDQAGSAASWQGVSRVLGAWCLVESLFLSSSLAIFAGELLGDDRYRHQGPGRNGGLVGVGAAGPSASQPVDKATLQ